MSDFEALCILYLVFPIYSQYCGPLASLLNSELVFEFREISMKFHTCESLQSSLSFKNSRIVGKISFGICRK